MANQYKNKVIYNGNVLIDLTGDDILESDVKINKKFHKADGSPATGTNTYDVDSSGATATDAEVLKDKTFGKGGSIHTGSMPNRGAATGTIASKNDTFTIPQGYHDGSGSVGLDATEKAKLIPENVRQGITLLGVQGSMSGTEDVTAEVVNMTPSATAQTRTPSTGYNYISEVRLAAIPYVEADNAAGGVTVTIG